MRKQRAKCARVSMREHELPATHTAQHYQVDDVSNINTNLNECDLSRVLKNRSLT